MSKYKCSQLWCQLANGGYGSCPCVTLAPQYKTEDHVFGGQLQVSSKRTRSWVSIGSFSSVKASFLLTAAVVAEFVTRPLSSECLLAAAKALLKIQT